MDNDNVYFIDDSGQGGGGATASAPVQSRPVRKPVRIPNTAAELATLDPAEIPSFTKVMGLVDNYMSRLPWWVVAGGAAGATWWVLRKR